MRCCSTSSPAPRAYSAERFGWGGGLGTPSSIEETALALDVFVGLDPSLALRAKPDAVNKGLAWLVEQVEQGRLSHPTPIGFYFAKLWYFEKLYPVIFTVGALSQVKEIIHPHQKEP